MFTSVIQVILILWFATPSESDVCSQNICQCTKFGRTRLIVECRVRGYLSAGIPSNTVELDLSSCSLSSITEDIFRNLTVLKKLDLSKNSLRHIPQNTFRNMEKLEIMKIGDNLLSIADVKVVLKGLTRLHRLHLDRNPLGPSLPSDIFTGFENMTYLSMIGCNLQKIENGSFRAMRHLQELDLSSNKLTHIHKGTVEGLTDQLSVLYLQGNEIETIGDGTLNQFKNLQRCWLDNNKLTSVPDLTGPKTLSSLNLQENQITDLSSIATSGIGHVYNLLLSNNRIDHLPPNIFHNTLVIGSLDLSFNKLKSLPDGIFNGLDQLKILVLTFNNITHINRRTFSGLSSLTTLLLIKNKLTFIAKDVFDETPSLKSL